MKIDPALPPPAGPQLPITAGAGPGRPFEDFLGGEAAPGRAFGFAEFGMFGREGQGQGPAQTLAPGKPPVDPDHAVLPVESLDEPVDGPATRSPAPVTSAVEPVPRPIRVLATPEARPRAPIARDTPADAGPVFPAPEPAPAEEEDASATATARRINRPRPPRADVSLIMTEKDGGVKLVIAGPALDPEACALLRRLARAILARSGLDLVQFHLNGVALAPDSTIMIGGSHGTRTR